MTGDRRYDPPSMNEDDAVLTDDMETPVGEQAENAGGTAPPRESPDREITTESIVEAILLATDTPVTPAKIAEIVGAGGAPEVKGHIAALNRRYEETGASFRIEEIAKGYQILTLSEYNVWLRKLLKVRSEAKLSQAALETLAVVAYKQPVLRVEIEEIRGVAAGDMLQRLREVNLVKIVGRAEEIGRPLLYGTTKKFLEVFGLASLEELPKIEALTPPDRQTKQSERPDAKAVDDAEAGPVDEVSTDGADSDQP